MDVRCEKCQTEYELDEARLKPGGVTVKCTNCGHMFKVRKRTITNVGTPPIARETKDAGGPRPPNVKPPTPAPEVRKPRPDSMFESDEQRLGADEAPTTSVERQWLIRLENGEQKSCRELGALQQWIVSGVVTRESQISRTGKTWKRLGDVADLGQYFAIADEARATRDRTKPVSRPAPVGGPGKDASSTMLGFGAAPQAAGGTILPDDDDETPEAITRSQMGRSGASTPPPVPRVPVRTPPMGSNAAGSAATQLMASPPQVRHPRTTPPPPRRPTGPSSNLAASPPPPAIPQGNRGTATWATDGVKPDASGLPVTGPFVGKLTAIPDEPAFAGRVRIAPGDESTFETGKVRMLDDDDDVLPANRGSRAGMWVLVIALLVMAGGGAAIYLFVIRDQAEQVAQPAKDAGAPDAVTAQIDAALVEPPAIDAASAEQLAAIDAARAELAADLEPRLRTAAQSLDGKPDAPSQALRAHLLARLAQDLQDRASATADTAAADALRKEAKQLVLDAATAAQRALKAAGDDAGANLAMAEVLRLQGKPASGVQRYVDTARAKADPAWARELALTEALVRVRDGKLDDARAALAAIDQGDGKLESSGDVRARLALALVLAAQDKASEAKPLVEAILAAQPEHATARALAGKLETQVTKSDPLPPEEGDPGKAPGAARPSAGKAPGAGKPVTPGPSSEADGGEPYDRLLKRANAEAEKGCGKAMELYAKALEQRPNGVEALAGMGYCHIDAKQFSSAFSKFRAALAVSRRYEPALRGIAEAYQQQGRKEQAIEAYRAYLEAYPGSVAAKRQLERLGGDTPAPPATQGDGSAAPAPPAPAPAAPPPAPEPAGNGSASE